LPVDSFNVFSLQIFNVQQAQTPNLSRDHEFQMSIFGVELMVPPSAVVKLIFWILIKFHGD
jgi:hypothetical protein